MHVKNNILGILYILLGSLLFLLVVGTWVIRLSMLLAALYFINQGLVLRGMSDLRGMMVRCLDHTKYYY
jgi:hypothetical protein